MPCTRRARQSTRRGDGIHHGAIDAGHGCVCVYLRWFIAEHIIREQTKHNAAPDGAKQTPGRNHRFAGCCAGEAYFGGNNRTLPCSTDGTTGYRQLDQHALWYVGEINQLPGRNRGSPGWLNRVPQPETAVRQPGERYATLRLRQSGGVCARDTLLLLRPAVRCHEDHERPDF